MAITDDILSTLDSGALKDIAQDLGIEQSEAKKLVRETLPAVLGGLEHNVGSDDGASSLAKALGDHADANPLGDLGSLLGGGLGGSILEHVLGGSTDQVSDVIASKTGASSSTVQKLMKILAPLVMAYLAKNVLSGGKADAGVVKEKVTKASKQAQETSSTPDLGSILGQILGGR